MNLKTCLFKMAMVMLAFVSVSCAKKNTDTAVVYSDDVIEINPSDVSIERNHSVKWSDDEGIVLVVFGYGFNDAEFLAEAKKVISSAYGLSENGGLVRCVVFPDDLHNRISNFRQIVDENNVRGIIVFGAPEGCHLTFAKIREDRNNNPLFSIFSFFPQDDVLGQEGTCSFVLDHESAGGVNLEEQGQVMDEDIFNILVSAIRYAALLPSELPVDGELHSHVQSIVGHRKVHRYVDGETGIQVRNHFVIESSE